MFDFNSVEISQLDDSQLRELVARLCAVELAGAGLQRWAVTVEALSRTSRRRPFHLATL